MIFQKLLHGAPALESAKVARHHRVSDGPKWRWWREPGVEPSTDASLCSQLESVPLENEKSHSSGKKASPVWSFCERTETGIKCLHCTKASNGAYGSNTGVSSLRRHLESRHSKLYKPSADVPSIPKEFQKLTTKRVTPSDEAKIDKHLVDWIAKSAPPSCGTTGIPAPRTLAQRRVFSSVSRDLEKMDPSRFCHKKSCCC